MNPQALQMRAVGPAECAERLNNYILGFVRLELRDGHIQSQHKSDHQAWHLHTGIVLIKKIAFKQKGHQKGYQK